MATKTHAVLEETDESKNEPNVYRNQLFKTYDNDTTYSRRNYNVNEYKHNNMIGLGYRKLVMRDFFINTLFAKVKCLEVAGKEP